MDNSRKPVKERRSEMEIKAILKKQEASNRSVKNYCQSIGISIGTFYRWRRLYSEMPDATGEFIEMAVESTISRQPLFAEIEVSGKAVIRLFRQVEPSYLKAFL